jgi:hypothetical protein
MSFLFCTLPFQNVKTSGVILRKYIAGWEGFLGYRTYRSLNSFPSKNFSRSKIVWRYKRSRLRTKAFFILSFIHVVPYDVELLIATSVWDVQELELQVIKHNTVTWHFSRVLYIASSSNCFSVKYLNRFTNFVYSIHETYSELY